MENCRLSVSICTFNRAAILEDALRSFAALERPADASFELLVIDNNSNDDTRAVVERCTVRATFPLRYVFEGRQGLSAARNRAVKEAGGEWIWYVDDDVFFSPNWLRAVLDGLERFRDAAALAGRVRLAFERARPGWLPTAALPFYGLTKFGDQPRWLGSREYPVGANVGFRRAVFDEVGVFREDLGRKGAWLLSAEESNLAMRLYDHDLTIAYLPDAAVQHRIAANRATMSWLRKRAYWGGVSHVLAASGTGPTPARPAPWRLSAGSVLKKGFGFGPQISYAFGLGMARQHLVQVLRGGMSAAGESAVVRGRSQRHP